MHVLHNHFHLSDWMHSIQSRLYFSNIITAVFFTVFALFYWNITLVSQRIDSQIDTISQLADQMNYAVTSLNSDLNSVFHYHNIDSNLGDTYRFFSQTADGADSERKKEFQQTLDMLVYLNTYISAAAYINNQQSAFIYSTGFYEQPEILNQYIDNYVTSTSKYYGSPVDMIVNGTRQNLIPIIKQIIDINTGRGIGYLVVYVNANLFFQSLDVETGVSSGYNTAVFSNGTLIYKTNVSPNYFNGNSSFHSVYDLYQYAADHMDPDGRCKSYHSGLIISSIKNTPSGWQFIKFSKDLSNSSSLSVSAIHYLYLCMIFLTFLIIFSLFVSRAITKDLRELCSMMKKVNLHKMNQIQFDHRTYIELEGLIHVYNRMIQKLNDGIQKEYLYDLRQKEMQIKVLNYQINPHFLYNALNLISSLAILHHIPTISQISIAMSDMFRYSISNRQFVTIEDELNNLKRYILIQDLRFPEKFCVNYDIEDRVLSNFCVKFLLQPLVENCFKHAFHFHSEQENKYMVTVTIKKEDNTVRISVTDNGCGINHARLQELNLQLSSPDHPHTDCSIGLWNVSKRISTYYGDSYGVHISSKENSYTTVTLTIPYIE